MNPARTGAGDSIWVQCCSSVVVVMKLSSPTIVLVQHPTKGHQDSPSRTITPPTFLAAGSASSGVSISFKCPSLNGSSDSQYLLHILDSILIFTNSSLTPQIRVSMLRNRQTKSSHVCGSMDLQRYPVDSELAMTGCNDASRHSFLQPM